MSLEKDSPGRPLTLKQELMWYIAIYCSQEVQVDVLKSTITDHYTVQTKLDEETKETGLKTLEYYRNWAVLENNSVLKKLVFKLKHKLQSFQETLSRTATQHLKNFILLMK